MPAATSRLAFARQGRGALLFADGQVHELPEALAGLAPLLTRGRELAAADLRPWLRRRPVRELVAALVDAGALEWLRARAPRLSPGPPGPRRSPPGAGSRAAAALP